MLYYYDKKYDLIREVEIVEVKTTGQYRIEDKCCYVNFVEPEELYSNLQDVRRDKK